MTSSTRRLILATALSMALLATAGPTWAAQSPAPASDADAPQAPTLTNPGFECNQGYSPQPGINGLAPNGWTAVLLDGRPELNSTRTYQFRLRARAEQPEGSNGAWPNHRYPGD